MKRPVMFALLLVSLLGQATTITTTKQIKDPAGNPLNGRIIFHLPAPATDTTNQQVVTPVAPPVRVNNGFLVGNVALTGNDTMSPKMYYSADMYDSTGRWLSTYRYYITGTTFDLGAAPMTPVTTSNISQQDWIVNNLTVNGILTTVGIFQASGSVRFTGPSPWVDPTASPYNCKFDDVTDDTACLQAAINATPHAGELRLPAGKSAFIQCSAPTNNTCLLVPYPMTIDGTGMNTDQFGSVLRFPTSVSNTTYPMRLLGDANGSDGYNLHDFAFQCANGVGVCGAGVLKIDVTSFPISRLTIARVAMGYGQWGGCGITITNPTPITNGFFVSDIGPNNIIKNGICGQNIGDSVRIWKNDIPPSVGALTCTPGLDLSYVPGARQTTISGNNITQTHCGALHLGAAARDTFVYNNFFEGGVSGTDIGSNGAIVDFDCTTTQHCQHIDFHDNTIQPVATNIDGVRFNFSDSANGYGNTLSRSGGTGVDYRITANASHTCIDSPCSRYEPTTDTITNILADSGVNTQYMLHGFQAPNGPVFGNRIYLPDGSQSTPSHAFTNEGNTGFYRASAGILGVSVTNTDTAIFQTNKIQEAVGNGYCWSSAGASAAANDTCLSRPSAGLVSADTTSIGNNLGSYKGRTFISAGTAAALTGTGACATFSTQTGGSSVGRATCTGTTGASTLTITPGITAPNGWVCNVQDQTTRANLLQQTSTTTTACTLTATSVTQNDVVVFTAFAF